MLKDIVEVRHLGGYRLHLRFEDGIEGELDFAGRLQFQGVFARLKDVSEFRKVRVNPESGTIEWPGDIDLDPDVLYAAITGKPIELAAQPA
jgi:hypothetical protein